MHPGRFEICLNVKDLGKSVEFYEKLGLERIGGVPEDGWAILKQGNCVLGLFQGHIDKDLLHFRGADLYKLEHQYEMKGLVPNKKAHIESDGSESMELVDPDGNVIYFNTFPEEPQIEFNIGEL
ncbi:MAG TPA: VOC family protein [Caldisericia bacterium]|nr:VOC family protein [Caldisericia bacterium]HPF49458.1 VOC family protein [Caldisericia bacterium]HPI84676.1 VOC family protein [Caldisericia bacterium]HPQ93627.1 VOC family protein [Caldisericia bacterium]HRV75598.1 VOC family protein [Caldisericia bacterium]